MRAETHLSSLDKQAYPSDHAIAFCTDTNYWPHLATAVKSVLVQAQAQLPEIYVFYDRENPRWMRKLKRLSRTYKQVIHFRRFSMDLIRNIEIMDRLGSATYFRIHLPDLLDKYKHILYLDSDLVATSDISGIFSYQPTGSLCIAARSALKVEATYHNERFGRPLDTPYCNAGVLLINAVRWKENKCAEAIMGILRDVPHLCPMADQDAINIFFNGHFQELPYEYNVTRRFYEEQVDFNYPGEEKEIKDAAEAPIIVHYTSYSKPWHLQNKHPLRHRYRNLRGSFHWYPYSLCISLAESFLELGQNAQAKLEHSAQALRHSLQAFKASIPINLKKLVFLFRPTGSLGGLRLRPSFEVYLPREKIGLLNQVAATGIYRLVDKNGNIVYISHGNIRDGVDHAIRQNWPFAAVEYSLLNNEKLEREWLAFWRYRHKKASVYQGATNS